MATPARARQTIRFGNFEADTGSGELRKFGHKMKLPDQSFRILVLLAERPGEVVTREELRHELWKEDTFVDFETGLNSAVRRLRDALNDSAEKPRFVETLPRRGYRFIADVEAVPVPLVPADGPPPTVATPNPRGWTWAAATAAGVLVLCAVAVTIFLLRSRTASVPVHSVAVLPLVNTSGDPTQDYFAAGITDALTTDIAQVGSLRVISRGSTMQYKTVGKPIQQVARELNVDAVVEGTVRRDEKRVWITARLLDGAQGKVRSSRSYEREVAGLPTLQAEVARDLLASMGAGLTTGEQARLLHPIEPDPRAYDLYLRARVHAGMENAEDNRAAIELLEQAVAIDSRFAAGYAALSDAYRNRGAVIGREEKEFEEKSMAAAEKALALDPELPDGYVVRGHLLWTSQNHFQAEAAAQDYRYALHLNPNLAEAHHQLANLYNHVGMLDRGLEEAQTAVTLDPLNTGAKFRVGVNLLYQGRYEESLAEIRDSQRFFPSLWVVQTSMALFQLGRREEAAARLQEFRQRHPEDPGGILTSMEALFAAAAGDRVRAEERIRTAITIGEGYQHFHHTAYVIGSAYALLNEPEKAMKFLRLAAGDGFPCYPLFASDHNLDGLRQDPRFQQFMTDLRAQWEHYKTTM